LRRLLERRFIHEERPNLRLNLDLDAMSADDRSHAAALLREALNRLSPLDRGHHAGTTDEVVAFAWDGCPQGGSVEFSAG
jgi:hypothetical protein